MQSSNRQPFFRKKIFAAKHEAASSILVCSTNYWAYQTLDKHIVGLVSNIAFAKFEFSCSTDQNFDKQFFLNFILSIYPS